MWNKRKFAYNVQTHRCVYYNIPGKRVITRKWNEITHQQYSHNIVNNILSKIIRRHLFFHINFCFSEQCSNDAILCSINRFQLKRWSWLHARRHNTQRTEQRKDINSRKYEYTAELTKMNKHKFIALHRKMYSNNDKINRIKIYFDDNLMVLYSSFFFQILNLFYFSCICYHLMLLFL